MPHDGSMGLVYVATWMLDFYGKLVGQYTIVPWIRHGWQKIGCCFFSQETRGCLIKIPPRIKTELVGGFKPSQKYARQIGSFPQGLGWKQKIFETTT